MSGNRCDPKISLVRRTTGTATRGTTAVSVGNTTLLVVVSSGGNRVGDGGVDAESEPSKESVADTVSEESVLHEGVDAVGADLLTQDTIILVEGNFLSVGSIRLEGFDLRDEILVEEGLSDMAGIVVAAESVVGEKSGVGVNHDVDVSRSAGVVTREDGLKLSNTVTVGLLDSAEPGLVDVCFVRVVAVAVCNDAGVNTSGVAVPHLEVDVGDGIAGLDIDDLVVEDNVESILLLDDVFSDILASDV
ncbi:hypothetical protein HG531_009803 [Fusarium graminearum]|nr:hypothetical protein HG531_009803 [Fusarium graminearum]